MSQAAVCLANQELLWKESQQQRAIALVLCQALYPGTTPQMAWQLARWICTGEATKP